CRKISLVRGFVPAIWLPSKSTIQRSAGVRSYLLTMVGVQTTSLGPMRQEILPPLPSTNCRSHSFRPTAQISFLMASASEVEKSPGFATDRGEGAASAEDWGLSPFSSIEGEEGPTVDAGVALFCFPRYSIAAWRTISSTVDLDRFAIGLHVMVRVLIPVGPCGLLWLILDDTERLY